MGRDRRHLQPRPSAALSQGGIPASDAAHFYAEQHQAQATIYTSPFPPADEMERLEQVHPGIAQILIDMTQIEGEHRRAMELADQRHRHRIEFGQSLRAHIGQGSGLLIALVGFGTSLWLGLASHDWLAGTISVADITALVYVFVVGRQPPKPKAPQKRA